MTYDILNAADHHLRNQACPLIIRTQLVMAFHSKSLSKLIQASGDVVDIEFLHLSYAEKNDLYFRDVAVCRNQRRYIIARSSIPSSSFHFFEHRFSIANQFPLGYFLFYGKGNIRINFKVEFSLTPPLWFLNDYPKKRFVIIRRSRWQMDKQHFLDLEEIFI